MSSSSAASDDSEDIEEMKHLEDVLYSFFYYPVDCSAALARMQDEFTRLSDRHKALVQDAYVRSIGQLVEATQANAALLTRLGCQRVFCEQSALVAPSEELAARREPPAGDENLSKVRSTLRQLVRDWSDEGRVEREASYGALLRELERHLPAPAADDESVRVAVPGSGLGRLVFELAMRGYSAQGNEFSYHMLIASYWLLNQASEPYGVTIYPWAHQTMNVLRSADRMRAVRVPDVCPALHGAQLTRVGFSMAAGEFVETYMKPECAGAFDAVLTCFFLDTAHNVLEYIDAIAHMLRKGGLWLNLGPLLYHYNGMPGEQSLELPYDMIHAAIEKSGFEYLYEETGKRCRYTSDEEAMMVTEFNCVQFTVRKR